MSSETGRETVGGQRGICFRILQCQLSLGIRKYHGMTSPSLVSNGVSLQRNTSWLRSHMRHRGLSPRLSPTLIYLLCFPSSTPAFRLFKPRSTIDVTVVTLERYLEALSLTAVVVDFVRHGKRSSRTPPIRHRCGEGRPGDTGESRPHSSSSDDFYRSRLIQRLHRLLISVHSSPERHPISMPSHSLSPMHSRHPGFYT